MKKAMIRHWTDGGDKHFTVTCKDMVTGEWEFICNLPYTRIDEIDVTPAWKELEKEKYYEFFVDLLDELRKYCKSFIIDKPATTIKEFLDLRAKNIGIESVELPVRKVKSCVKLKTNLEGATAQDFDPNKYVWAYRFI